MDMYFIAPGALALTRTSCTIVKQSTTPVMMICSTMGVDMPLCSSPLNLWRNGGIPVSGLREFSE